MRPAARIRVAAALAFVVIASTACGAVGPTAPSPPPTVTPRPTVATGSPPPAPSSPTSTKARATPRASITQATPTHIASRSPTPQLSPTPSTSSTPSTGMFGRTRVEIPQGHGAAISFTFDDGPSPTYTPQVLALLKKNHVPAVFCLIGTEAHSYPTLARQEVQAGHQLCDHSRDHDLTMNHKSKAYVTAEVNDGLADIRAAAPGVPVAYYRQPGGLWSPAVVHAMTRAGLHPLRWSNDPRDWSRPGSTVIVQRVLKNLQPGAVILMHDGGGDRSQTVAALAWLLPTLQAAGWHPVIAPKVTLTPEAAARPQ